MNTKRAVKGAPKPATTTTRGTVRVYVDLPAESVRRFNVLAAMRSVPKRLLLTQIVEDVLKDAKIP